MADRDITEEVKRLEAELRRLDAEMAQARKDSGPDDVALNQLTVLQAASRGKLRELEKKRSETFGQLQSLRLQDRELVDQISSALPKSDARPPQPDSKTQETKPLHPILAVAGSFADLMTIARLVVLPHRRPGFSVGTKLIFGEMFRASDLRTDDGRVVAGTASFIRVCLAQEIQAPSSLFNRIASYVLEAGGDDPAFRDRFAKLKSSALPKSARETAVAHREFTTLLGKATAIVARLTPGQTRIDLRHIILAALREPEAQRVFHDLGVVRERPAHFFEGLFSAIEEYLHALTPRVEAVADSMSGLAEIVAELKANIHPAPELPLQSTIRYVDDEPVRELGEDRLGVGAEARALAEIVCLKIPGPPLAIGLFGDWGSGKSTFMYMLEAAINRIAKAAHDAKESNPTAIEAEAMVSKVVHIRFNAWHYNEDNLWASLTSEFFVQLRAGGGGRHTGERYADLVKAVVQRAAGSEGEVLNQVAVIESAKESIKTLESEIIDLSRPSAATVEAVAVTAKQLVADLGISDAFRVRELMKRLGHPLELPKGKENDEDEIAKAIEAKSAALEQEIARAAKIPGQVQLVWRSALKAWRKREWLSIGIQVSALTAIAGIVALVPWISLSDTVKVIGAFGALMPLVAPLWWAYRGVATIIAAADTFERNRQKALEQRAQDRWARETMKQRALDAIVEAQGKQAALQRDAARFRNARPDQVIDYLLNVSEDTRQFDKELGTVSQVRRVFEQLNEIFEERRRLERKFREGEIPEIDRDDARQKLLRANRITDGIDRIILYIDDLDRCSADQVVRVLEAVHLLLAFKLFVVVVGVDARWLQQSLLKVYGRQLRENSENVVEEIDRGTVQDYLEKIFQVPIHLRRFGAVAGSFQSYIKDIAGHIDEGEVQSGSLGGSQSDDPIRDQPEDDGVTAISPIDVAIAASEDLSETVKRIALRRAEVNMFDTLSPLLSKSPRAVKRFMNIYRLIRGLKRGADLDALLTGDGKAPPSHPAVLFWLAVRVGLTPEMAAWFRSLIVGLHASDLSLLDLKAMLEGKPYALTEEILAPLEDVRKSVEPDMARAYVAMIEALAKALPGSGGMKILCDAEAETVRFTLAGT